MGPRQSKPPRSDCATANALEVVGDRWSLLILRDYIFLGFREYGDFLTMREGIATNILASRLAWLCDSGLLIKHPHPSNRKKYYYEITEKGFHLILVIMDLAAWSWKFQRGTFSPKAAKRLFIQDRELFLKTWWKKVKERSREYLAAQ